MAEGVPRERRATTCRGDGSERRPSDPTVDLQKEITALAGVISRMVVQVATLTKQFDDERNIRANQQQIGRGSEQRRGDCQRSQRYAQRRRYSRHAYFRGRCYACGKLGHIRRWCTRFAREQSREHVRASRCSENIQQSRRLGENARTVENCPTKKRIVAYEQEAHVQCDMQRDPEMDHEKGRRPDTHESRSGESCAVSTSERRHLSAEKHNTPIGTCVSCEKQTRVSRHTQTLTIQDALPVISVSPRSHPERPHNIADETSREDPVKHDIVDVDGGLKTSDERPKVRSMLPRNSRHDTNVTECTLAIGDFVFIRDRTCRGRNEIQYMWSIIVYVVMCVPYDVSNVYVVMPATGGLKKTLNRSFLLPARPPVTYLDHSTQEDSLSDGDAIPIVPEIATDPPDSEGMVEAVSTQHKHATWWRW